MAVKSPITIEGNLIADPDTGVTDDQKAWTRFTLAVNDRQFDEESGKWIDGEPIFHQVAVFGQQAENAAKSLREGDRALVSGDLTFSVWHDAEGKRRQGSQIIAKALGPSLRFATAEVTRNPKVTSPGSAALRADASATGPVATPGSQTDFEVDMQ